jgi:hypothetical protein
MRLFECSDGSGSSAPLKAGHTRFADITIAMDQTSLGMDKISDIGKEAALRSESENREGLVTRRAR